MASPPAGGLLLRARIAVARLRQVPVRRTVTGWTARAASLLRWLRGRGDTVVVSYVDRGENFAYHAPAIREAFAPLPVEFERNGYRPALVVGSVFGQQYRRVPRDVPRILFVGEPEFDRSRAASYDLVVHTVAECAGTVYVPFYVTSFGERRRNTPGDLVKDEASVRAAIAAKSRFCAFLYRRRYPPREALFDALSAIHPVDALGRSRATARRWRDDRDVSTSRVTYNDLAVQAYRPYRFVICGENSSLPGYVTEKIVNAMLALAIPIYLGAPDIGSHFNPRSFVNANDLTPAELLETVRRLDSDPDAYAAMLAEPWFEGNRLPPIFGPSRPLIDAMPPLRERVIHKPR